jgi:hypothetical protein
MTDITTAKVTSSGSRSGSVKIEPGPSSQTNSSIMPGEPRKEYFPNNCQSLLKVLVAHEPAQALRDQIALLNANRSDSQGACTPLCYPM